MVIIILLNLIIIICIYFKYYNSDKNIKFTKEQIEELSPAIIGYVNNKGLENNYDLILSEILDLNVKGYLTIEYVKEDISEYNYIIKQNLEKDIGKLEKYEIIVMNFLFENNTQITREELEEKSATTFKTYNTQYNQLGELIKEELIEQNFIEKEKTEKIKKITKWYIRISLILIIIFFMLKVLIYPEKSIIYIQIYILEKIISTIMLLFINSYTDKGIALKNGIDEYRKQLENEEYLVDNKKMKEIICEKRFINSVALHIETQAKRELINERMIKNAKIIAQKVVIEITIIAVVFVSICAIVLKISQKMSIVAFFWIYIIMAIIVAGVVDAAKLIATSNRKKW